MPAQLPSLPPLLRRPAQRRRLAGHQRVALLCLIGAGAFFALTNAGRDVRTVAPLGAEIDRVAGAIGVGLEQVSITGQRFTADADIYDALQLKSVATLLSFDAAAARRRVEALPWVETATIERALPGGLTVAVRERRPVAIWRVPQTDRHVLIDATGRVLSDAPGQSVNGMPVLSGAGAPAAVAPLLAALTEHPGAFYRLRVAERVGERRWTLHLDGWPKVHLPETGESAAMTLLETVLHRHTPAALTVVDLRIRGRVGLSPATAPRRS